MPWLAFSTHSCDDLAAFVAFVHERHKNAAAI